MPSLPRRVIKRSSPHETGEVHVLCRGPKEMNLVIHRHEGEQQAEGAQRNTRYQDCAGRKFPQSVLRMRPEPRLRRGTTESRTTRTPKSATHNGTHAPLTWPHILPVMGGIESVWLWGSD